MRLFQAIPIPPAIQEQLAASVGRNRIRGLKPVATENLHLTLKFFGEVADAEVPWLQEQLAALPAVGPVRLQCEGIELFPPRGPVRIVAAKVSGDLDRLQGLTQALERIGQAVGVAPERRPFRPHVTLARARSGLPYPMRDRLTSECSICSASFEATEHLLLRSHLLPAGPLYRPLSIYPLGETGGGLTP